MTVHFLYLHIARLFSFYVFFSFFSFFGGVFIYYYYFILIFKIIILMFVFAFSWLSDRDNLQLMDITFYDGEVYKTTLCPLLITILDSQNKMGLKLK